MKTIKYESYSVEDKTLLKVIKENAQFFRMFGFITLEQNENYKLSLLSKNRPLITNYKKSKNEIFFEIQNEEQKITMVSNLNSKHKCTEFNVLRKEEDIHIVCYNKHASNISITMTKKQTPYNIMMKIDNNGIYLYKNENHNEKVLRYTDLTTTRELPNLVASYYESSKQEENRYQRLVEINQYQERKGFYLETNHNYNGQVVFSRRNILLNRKDAASYALELIETKEVQNLIKQTFNDFEQSLTGFLQHVHHLPISNQLFRNEVDSEIYRIYCGVQRKLHEMSNPIRIEQLLEEMTFEKGKTKTLKNKA